MQLASCYYEMKARRKFYSEAYFPDVLFFIGPENLDIYIYIYIPIIYVYVYVYSNGDHF